MPSQNDYQATAWGKPKEYDFTCPSGQKCLLRKIDPFDLLAAELLDKLDFVTSVVMNKHVANAKMSNVDRIKAQRAAREKGDASELAAAKEMAAAELINDPKKLKDFQEVMESVMLFAVVAPKLTLPPAKDEDRQDGEIYTDTVDFQDKMAIFSKVMEGVNVAERFRERSEELVAAVASEPGVRKPAQRRSRAKGSGSAS